jgi:hypothetical protein
VPARFTSRPRGVTSLPDTILTVTISVPIGTLGPRREHRTTSSSMPENGGVGRKKARCKLATASRRLGLQTCSIGFERRREGAARGWLETRDGDFEKPRGPRLLRRRRERASSRPVRASPRRRVTSSGRLVTWSRPLGTPTGPLAISTCSRGPGVTSAAAQLQCDIRLWQRALRRAQGSLDVVSKSHSRWGSRPRALTPALSRQAGEGGGEGEHLEDGALQEDRVVVRAAIAKASARPPPLFYGAREPHRSRSCPPHPIAPTILGLHRLPAGNHPLPPGGRGPG